MVNPDNHFAMPGDSGSLVFNEDGPFGLIQAGDEDTGEIRVCKALHIEKLLNISFTPPQTIPSKYPFDPSEFPTDPKVRFEILIGGISIGHEKVSAGTLGTFVWDNETGEILGLTCAHVAAPPEAKIGDPIYQPGPYDIRSKFHREPTDEDIAGYLVRWIPISFTEDNLVDAALFRPIRPVWPNYMLGTGERPLNKPVDL